MIFYGRTDRWIGITVLLSLLMWALTGCGAGPASISRGRSDYNEVINRTDDEQLLMTIIRNRYGETFNTLAVTSVTANVQIRTSAGINVGVGPSDNYAGNLVPLSGGFAYEENPTISYTPIEGEQYIQQLLSPIPLNLLLLLATTANREALAFRVLVTRINDLWNPVFFKTPAAKPEPRFYRCVELMTELMDVGVMDFVKNPRKNIEYAAVFHDYAPLYTEKVKEILFLLGLSMPEDGKANIVLPVSLSVGESKWGGIAIVTRSVFDVLDIMSASIDVPEDHDRSGLAIKYPRKSFGEEGFRIQRSEKRPKHASVAVKYRKSWFYIDETDQTTKLMFRLARILWSVRITETAAKTQSVPVLTIPAAR